MVFHDVSKALAGSNLQGLLCFWLFHVVAGYLMNLAALLSAYPQRKNRMQPNGKKVNRYKG
jgi:hypothetical protein